MGFHLVIFQNVAPLESQYLRLHSLGVSACSKLGTSGVSAAWTTRYLGCLVGLSHGFSCFFPLGFFMHFS